MSRLFRTLVNLVDAPATDKPFWRSKRWIASAAFIGVIVVGWAAASVFAGSSHPQATPAAVTSGLRHGAAPSDCHLPAGDQHIPLVPLDVRWENIGTYRVPAAHTLGPAIREGHIRRCYAHGPQGAVVAAMNYPALADTYSTDTAMLKELTAPSQARDDNLRSGGDPQTGPEHHHPIRRVACHRLQPTSGNRQAGAKNHP